MKRVLSVVLALILVCACAISAVAAPYAETIDAEAVLLLDMETGEVLHAVSESKRVYPAGTTKLMTALVAYELCSDLDVSFEITAEALYDISAGNDKTLSPMLSAGETVTMRDILGGVLIGSGNDAAAVAAYYAAGSIDKFVEHMNSKAAELGMTGTHYTNPHGRSGEDHYTTAADMGKLMTEIFKTPDLLALLNQDGFTFCEDSAFQRELKSGNMFFVGNDVQKYSNGTASLGGYTDNAGGCLVASAEKNGVKLLCMVFGAKSSDDTWIISKKLFEYAFALTVKYTGEELLGGVALPVEEKMEFIPDFSGITIEVSKYLDVSDPTVSLVPPADEESQMGSAKYYTKDGTLLATVPVTFVELKPPLILRILKIIGIVVLIIVVLLVLAFVVLKILQIKHEKEKARRRALREERRAQMLEQQRQNVDYSDFTEFEE